MSDQLVKVHRSAAPPSYMANVQVPLGIGVYIGVQVFTVGVKPVGPVGPNGGTTAILASALKIPV